MQTTLAGLVLKYPTPSTRTPRSTSTYCSSTHQDSLPCLVIISSQKNPTPTQILLSYCLHLHYIPLQPLFFLFFYSVLWLPVSFSYKTLFFMNSYKYTLDVPVFLILDIKLFPSNSLFSPQFSFCVYLPTHLKHQLLCQNFTYAELLCNSIIANTRLSSDSLCWVLCF